MTKKLGNTTRQTEGVPAEATKGSTLVPPQAANAPAAKEPVGQKYCVESDDFGDDWPIFGSMAEAEAFIEKESIRLAREGYCDGGEVGLYGPCKGIPIDQIIQDIRERNKGAIRPSTLPGIRVSELTDEDGHKRTVVHGIAEDDASAVEPARKASSLLPPKQVATATGLVTREALVRSWRVYRDLNLTAVGASCVASSGEGHRVAVAKHTEAASAARAHAEVSKAFADTTVDIPDAYIRAASYHDKCAANHASQAAGTYVAPPKDGVTWDQKELDDGVVLKTATIDLAPRHNYDLVRKTLRSLALDGMGQASEKYPAVAERSGEISAPWDELTAGRALGPTPSQRALMGACARALVLNVFYTKEFDEVVLADLGPEFFVPGDLGKNTINTENGNVGFEIYIARKYIEHILDLAANQNAIGAYDIKPGNVYKNQRVAGHTFSTLTVQSVELAHGKVVLACTKRGTKNTWKVRVDARHPMFVTESAS